MKRLMKFEYFYYAFDAPESLPDHEIQVFDMSQYEEYCDHVHSLEDKHDTHVHWDLLTKNFWDMYLRKGKKVAVVEMPNNPMNEKLITALLSPDHMVEVAYYADDTKCSDYVLEQIYMMLVDHKNENMEYEESEDICTNCGCNCDKCECENCDCSDDWKEQSVSEVSQYDTRLSEKLLQAVTTGKMKEVDALLESGADISYRRYLAIKRAALKENVEILESLFGELDKIDLGDAEELIEVCRMQEVPRKIMQIVESEVKRLLFNSRRVMEKKSTSYKKSGLKHPEKADLNKDKKISGYEKARGKAIQKSVQSEKEEKGAKGLTAKQRKSLPKGLIKSMEARMKKKR